jgi:hypothetical protein
MEIDVRLRVKSSSEPPSQKLPSGFASRTDTQTKNRKIPPPPTPRIDFGHCHFLWGGGAEKETEENRRINVK